MTDILTQCLIGNQMVLCFGSCHLFPGGLVDWPAGHLTDVHVICLMDMLFDWQASVWSWACYLIDRQVFDRGLVIWLTGKCLIVGLLFHWQDFWDELFAWSKSWGLVSYEQDWLNYQIENINFVQSDLSLGGRWLRQMGEAAERHGITIQYCMALPRHMLASLEIPAVSQVVSFPFCCHGYYCNMSLLCWKHIIAK